MATITWANPGTPGNWSVAGNWSPSSVPAADDDVTISGSSSSYTVSLDVNSAALDSLTIDATLGVGAQTLNVTGTGSGATDTISLFGSVSLFGGTINATTLALGSGGGVSGFGKLNIASFDTGGGKSGGNIDAIGGTLELGGTIAASFGSFQVETGAANVLQIDGTVGSGNTFRFAGSQGALALADDTGFNDTIFNVNVAATKTNFIDIEGHTVTISSVTGLGTNSGTITLSDGVTLNLSGISSQNWSPNAVGDGDKGTDIFLTTAAPPAGTVVWANPGTPGNWSVAGNWSPSGVPAADDDVTISGSSSSYTVSLDVNSATLDSLTLGTTLGVGSQTLNVTGTGAGATDTITLSGGSLSLFGGTINATTLAFDHGSVSGFGMLNITGSYTGGDKSTGNIDAIGGTLELGGTIAASFGSFQIDNGAANVLQIDGAVGSGSSFRFAGSQGALALADDTGFNDTIVNLNVAATKTNFIDIEGHTVTISSVTGQGTNSGTITLSDGVTLNLFGISSQNWSANAVGDGNKGTDIFLTSAAPPAGTVVWANPGTPGSWSVAGNWNPSAVPGADNDVTIAGSSSFYTVSLDVNSAALDSLTLSATLGVGAQTLNVTGTGSGATDTISLLGGRLSLFGGTINATTLALDNASALSGFGMLNIADFDIAGGKGGGSIEATGGTLELGGTIAASFGSFQIDNGAANVLQIDGAVDSGSSFRFVGPQGALALADDTSFHDTILNLNVAATKTNFIDIEGHTVTISSVTGQGTNSGTITLSDGVTLNLFGISSQNWSANAVGDGNKGTDIYLGTACYCRGTLILTEQHEVPVEELRIGDLVLTFSGKARPIRWIGRRGYDGRFVAGNRDVLPICIKPDAIMKGVPARDLWVSPEHSLYIDDVLVQAKHLINGTTVVQAESVREVEYFHIELDSHDVIYADGTAAETFVDCDNRQMFANGHVYEELYPNDERARWQFCAPRLEGGSAELISIRESMFDRARQLGHIPDDDLGLYVVVDGAVQRPTLVSGNVYRFVLPTGRGAIWLGSQSFVPAERNATSRDIRRLGVPLERLVLSDAELSLEAWHGHSAFRDGFHTDESAHRWTNGMARIPLTLLRPFPGAVTVDVHLNADLHDTTQTFRSA